MVRWFKAKAVGSKSVDTGGPAVRARPTEIIVWLTIAILWTAAWCWGSVLLAERFAPVIVLPILSGLVLGAGYVLAMRPAGLASRPWLLSFTFILSLALTAGQHFVWYEITQTKIEESYNTKLNGDKLSGLVATIPALHPNFVEFLQSTAERGRAWFTIRLYGDWVWASWALDAALQSGTAILLVWLAAKQPYCSRCRSWYRAVRTGQLNERQASALAAMYGLDPARPDQYRLLHCLSGCGPMRLELLGASSAARRSAWLDDEARRNVLKVLDDSQAGSMPETSAMENPR